MKNLLIEAFLVGIITLLSSFIFNLSKKYNIFMMGFFIHIICDITKLNKYYCKHGYACNNA